jgi:CRP-like cAMP-binding protein
MLGQEKRNQTVIAIEDTNLLYINGRDFKRLFENKYVYLEVKIKKRKIYFIY